MNSDTFIDLQIVTIMNVHEWNHIPFCSLLCILHIIDAQYFNVLFDTCGKLSYKKHLLMDQNSSGIKKPMCIPSTFFLICSLT